MQESLRVRSVQSPIIPVIADLIRSCPGTISLGQGVVNYGPPPEAYRELERFHADPVNHKYQSVTGVPALLDAITAKLAAENGIPLTTENRVMVTAGGNNAFLNAVLAIADPGDEVILPTPYYFNQEMAVTMANCRPVLVPTDENCQLRLDAIRDAITPRTRGIVTVSPNNPSGAVYPEADLRAVNQLCAEHGIYHISDEAYEYFTYDGARHYSAASQPGAAGHTISLFSLSKAYGFASWRIGWMVFPARLEAALRKIQDTILICSPVVSQYAAVGALHAGRAYAAEKLVTITESRTVARNILASLKEGIVPRADGAFYLLLRLSTRRDPLELAEKLIREHGVAVIPGNAFGLTQGCHLRVAYAAQPPAVIREGCERLVRGLQALLKT